MTNPVIPALLPAGLMDVLPPRAAFEAATVERLVARFTSFGYERIKPPLIEF
jgi:ATP phosphoribosyltransferase regulatory subunit